MHRGAGGRTVGMSNRGGPRIEFAMAHVEH